MIEDIERLVTRESPSEDLDAVARGAHVAGEHVLVDRLEPRIRPLTAPAAELLEEERA